jgi:hypothetical protein
VTGLFGRLRTLAAAAPLAAALALPLAGVAHADQRDFTLVNNTSAVLTHVYVSPTAVDDWGDDVLGRDVLASGENVFIYFGRFDSGACGYDVKVVSDAGAEGKLMGVDLCATDTVTFADA